MQKQKKSVFGLWVVYSYVLQIRLCLPLIPSFVCSPFSFLYELVWGVILSFHLFPYIKQNRSKFNHFPYSGFIYLFLICKDIIHWHGVNRCFVLI